MCVALTVHGGGGGNPGKGRTGKGKTCVVRLVSDLSMMI